MRPEYTEKAVGNLRMFVTVCPWAVHANGLSRYLVLYAARV